MLYSISHLHRSNDGLNFQRSNKNAQRLPLSNVQNLRNTSSTSPSHVANINVHSPMKSIFANSNSKASKPIVKENILLQNNEQLQVNRIVKSSSIFFKSPVFDECLDYSCMSPSQS